MTAVPLCTPSASSSRSVIPVRVTMFSGSFSPSGSLMKVSILPATRRAPAIVRSTRSMIWSSSGLRPLVSVSKMTRAL